VKQHWHGVGVIGAGLMVGMLSGSLGCKSGDSNAITDLPAEIVVWGDTDPDNDAAFASIRDANDVDDRFVVIGTNDQVQFSNSRVCNTCTVDGYTISVDGTPRVNIRFSSGPDGFGVRRPFLVSTDGFYVQLLLGDDKNYTFQEVDQRFEDPDNLTDDVAVQVGTIPNPALDE
jgi:hypothetical protein